MQNKRCRKDLYLGQPHRVLFSFSLARMSAPWLFNLYAEYIMQKAGLDESQAGIKTAGRNINNLRYADDTTLMAESEEELKSLLLRVKEEWKSWLKTHHSKNKDLVPSYHGKKMGKNGNSDRLYFLGLQNLCRWWLQPWNEKTLAPWKKSCDKPRQRLKSRHITLLAKDYRVKVMVFPVVMLWMWELDHKEGWVPKNWCFQAVVLEKTLESPLDSE